MSTDDISELLSRWSQAKSDMTMLEKRMEKYKKLATMIMDKNGINTIANEKYQLRRTNMTRRTISHKDVPEDIWEKYSKSCSYPAFYISDIEKPAKDNNTKKRLIKKND